METEELYSQSLAPLVVSPFSIEWSEDNHISVLTEKGVHVFELIPSPMSPQPSMKFSRTFVYPPSSTFSDITRIGEESVDWRMKREEMFSLMMDEGVTPKPMDLCEVPPRITSVTWSPRDLVYPDRCLLCILTSAGTLMVLRKVSMSWYPVYDLSTLRSSQTRLSETDEDSEYLRIKEKAYAQQATCACWSGSHAQHSFLAVTYRNGEVVIFKLPRIGRVGDVPIPAIVGTANLSESIKISALFWMEVDVGSCLLVLGYFDGRIGGVEFEKGESSFVFRCANPYYDCRDRIAVTALRILSENETETKVLASKGAFLLLLHFARSGTLLATRYIQTEGYSVSGITCINDHQVLIATENGVILCVESKENELLRIETKSPLPRSRFRCLGLAHSPSLSIFLTITSPSSMYDHLVTREPSKLYFFCLKNAWDVPSMFQRKDELSDIWDLVELVRLKTTRAQDPLNIISKLPADLERLNLRDLRLTMWLTLIREVCEKKRLIQGPGSITGEISEAQPLIIVQTACDYLERLLKKPSLSTDQEKSVNLLRMYLEVFLAGEEESLSVVCERAKRMLSETRNLSSVRIEECELCGEAIREVPWRAHECPNGHVLPRCARTLLEITSVKYSTCPICGQIFHVSLLSEYDVVKCPFCDVPALTDNRILGTKRCPTSEQILSRRWTKGQGQIETTEDLIDGQSSGCTRDKREHISIKEKFGCPVFIKEELDL